MSSHRDLEAPDRVKESDSMERRRFLKVTAAASNTEDEFTHEKPICTTIIGDLFADDKILSVAHAYQSATDWHLMHPDLR